jgi:signal recognition particle GTPase
LRISASPKIFYEARHQHQPLSMVRFHPESRLDRFPTNDGAFGMDLNDLRQQIVELKKMGPVHDLAAKIPGPDQAAVDRSGLDFNRESRRILGMIDSMTSLERSYPFLITVPGRCARIADGAGVEPSEVAGLFVQIKAMSDVATRLERGRWRRI